jgi:nucleotide-binding universal stress UspA family protein
MPAQRVLVPINGGPGDEHALRVAVNIYRRARAEILILYVVEVPQSLPLDAELPAEIERGDAAMSRAEAYCREEKVAFEAEMLQARGAGATIVDEATQRESDLIILSVAGRQRHGEFTLGRTAPYVLKNAACEVWVMRRARDSG